MGYVPQFKNDIFVSYRHSSNEGQDKWVDTFCKRLEERLTEFVGDITIWKDKTELRAGDLWRPEIAEALDSAAIFLAIISRTYFESDVCRCELDQFLGRTKEAAEALQRRLVPIFKQPTKPGQELPQELAQIHHHEFFQLDPPGSTRFKEFGPETDANRFWETLEQLAQDLMDALETLKGEARKRVVGTVYLARVGPELQAERAKLRSDLQQRGYLVVPECEYLWNATDFHEKIADDLNAAQLCVHQVARTPSIDPNTAERARLQLDLATQTMKSKGKSLPLVWIQPASETDESARALIDYIEQELSNEGVEYSQENLEDFKTQIYDKLPRRTAAPSREVALLVEEGDVAATGEINALLVDKLGVDPRRIKLTGSNLQDPSSLAKVLARCGKCVIFWGGQAEAWVSDILTLDVLAGYIGKEKLCVYGAAPASPEKSTFRTTQARIIDAMSGGQESDLRQFLGTTEIAR
jgi:hypothetical protein